jgi:tetratricopeptide (TPR) repeat protein
LLHALHVFEQHHLLDVWQDGKIRVSGLWDDDIKQAMGSARIAVVLLTTEALDPRSPADPNYILNTEFPYLHERQRSGQLTVFPVVCEDCDWRAHDWLRATQASNPLSKLTPEAQDRFFRSLATEIAEQISRIALAELPRPDHTLPPDCTYLDKFPLTRSAGRREEKLIGREQEVALLDLAVAQPHTAIVSLVAWGGVGKTVLVKHWLQQLERKGWFSARRVYAWSFYSQGTTEDRQASEDSFLAHALEWFGVQCEPTLSPWDKGRLLAHAATRERTLLILDGIEPLQYPPGPRYGELHALGLQSLLKQLARNANNTEYRGLCLITTRAPLTDLTDFQRRPDAAWGSALGVELCNLTEEAGAALLHHAGAKRAGAAEIEADDAELLAASREVDGHALTLNLLGRYLDHALDGDVSRRGDWVKFEEADRKEERGTTFKMLAAFESWFSKGGEFNARQLAILRILGLFDRPADASCTSALRRPPIIVGLTDSLFTLRQDERTGQPTVQPLLEHDWKTAVSFLRNCGLVAMQAEAGHSEQTLDCHSLIREYFGNRARKEIPEGWQLAHERLYLDLMARAEKKQHPSLEELQPFYQAVVHGCEAGWQFHACVEAYDRHIRKRQAQYSRHALGAYSSDLTALRHFFEPGWVCNWPLPDRKDEQGWLHGGGMSFAHDPRGVLESDQRWLRGEVALCLAALGRLREARDLMQTTLEAAIRAQDWKEAGLCSNNLAEFDLALGDVGRALQDAQRSTAFIHDERAYVERRSGSLNDVYVGLTNYHERELMARTILGYSAFSSGMLEYARRVFGELFDGHVHVVGLNWMHHDFFLHSVEPIVWSLILAGKTAFQNPVDAQGHTLDATASNYFHHCSVVMQWADETLGQAGERSGPLAAALAHDAKGRARLCQGAFLIGTGTLFLSECLQEASAAVDGLCRYSNTMHMPWGYIHRAWARALMGDFAGARDDLDDAWDIAERGPMRLHLADIHLHRAPSSSARNLTRGNSRKTTSLPPRNSSTTVAITAEIKSFPTLRRLFSNDSNRPPVAKENGTSGVHVDASKVRQKFCIWPRSGFPHRLERPAQKSRPRPTISPWQVHCLRNADPRTCHDPHRRGPRK